MVSITERGNKLGHLEKRDGGGGFDRLVWIALFKVASAFLYLPLEALYWKKKGQESREWVLFCRNKFILHKNSDIPWDPAWVGSWVPGNTPRTKSGVPSSSGRWLEARWHHATQGTLSTSGWSLNQLDVRINLFPTGVRLFSLWPLKSTHLHLWQSLENTSRHMSC